jgi:uncharacterized protein
MFVAFHRGFISEMDGEQNIRALVEIPPAKDDHILFRRGPIIDISRGGPHPKQIARSARRVVASVELARGASEPGLEQRLVNLGICRTLESARNSLIGLRRQVWQPKQVLNNLYLHLTFRCQLNCNHCYARASVDATAGREPTSEDVVHLVQAARRIGFKKVILTGGEPMLNSDWEVLLDALDKIRGNISPLKLYLRTNLALPLKDEIISKMASCFDLVGVSVDGDKELHDLRRGHGTYQITVENLARCAKVINGKNGSAQLMLAGVLSAADAQGSPGQMVRELGRKLGIRRVQFRPLLPLGRAQDLPEQPSMLSPECYDHPFSRLEAGFIPMTSCGMGQNLYIEPDGQAFPCYAFHKPHSYLGNVLESGLESVLNSHEFKFLATRTVDTNRKCMNCLYRYLCGGACRAWGGEATKYDLDAPPQECGSLYQAAEALYQEALSFLEIA